MKMTTAFIRILSVLGVLLLGTTGALAAQELQNLAALGQGGHLVFFTSQYDNSTWRAANLIDGSANTGWAGQTAAPQSIIIAFRDEALAEIHDVVINPYTREDPSEWAKEVEIQVSTTLPFRDFRSVGKFTLSNEGRAQVFSFPQPIQARYVKVLFLSNYGGGYMEAGEVQVMGRLLPDAPPAPDYRNVAAASAGARIESFTSQYDDSGWAVANLLKEDDAPQWAAQSAASQEVVIALPEVSQITDVAINNYAKEDPSNWAKDVVVEVSATSSYKDFQRIGTLSMPPVGDLHTLTLTEPVEAKYVKVLFRSNRGGGYMEAARVRVYEVEDAGTAELARQLQETGRAVVREIRFPTNSAEILPESETVLRQIADLLRQDPQLELIIEGHTDNVGGAEFNLELSRKRAEAVKRWLVDRAGIGEIRLTTVGHGLTRPVASNDTEEGRAQNRRVELVKRQ